MTKDELREKLKALLSGVYDPEEAHSKAEELLLEYINDPEITSIWNAAKFWYA